MLIIYVFNFKMNVFLVYEYNFNFLITEAFLAFSICFLIIYGSFFNNFSKNTKFSGPVLSQSFSTLTIQISFISFLLSISNPFMNTFAFYGFLVNDSLTICIKTVIFFFSVLFFINCYNFYLKNFIISFEYNLLILMSLLSISLLTSSYDLIAFYLALEFQSLIFYILAAFKRGSSFSTEAGIKYFIIGAFSSGFLLFGCSLIYGCTGMTNFEDLRLFMCSSNLTMVPTFINFILFIGIFFILVSILFKMGSAPFHFWVPDVYEGSVFSTSIFFSVIPKIVLISFIIRLCFDIFFNFFFFYQSIFFIASISSLIFSSLIALYQTKIKRFLAFSSVAHVGFIIIAFSCGTFESLNAIIIYNFFYISISFTLWSILIFVHDKINKGSLKFIDQIKFFYDINVFVCGSVILILFSMAGIPPMAGFFAKIFIFFSAIESSQFFLAVISVTVSVLGSFYYLRWIKNIFFDKSFKALNSTSNFSFEISYIQSLSISFFVFILSTFFYYPSFILILCHKISIGILYLLFKNV